MSFVRISNCVAFHPLVAKFLKNVALLQLFWCYFSNPFSILQDMDALNVLLPVVFEYSSETPCKDARFLSTSLAWKRTIIFAYTSSRSLESCLIVPQHVDTHNPRLSSLNRTWTFHTFRVANLTFEVVVSRMCFLKLLYRKWEKVYSWFKVGSF